MRSRPSLSFILLFLGVFGAGLGIFTRHNQFEVYCHPDEFGKARQLVRKERNFNHPMLMLTTVELVDRVVLSREERKDFQTVAVTGRWATAACGALAAASLALLAARQYNLWAGWLTGLLAVCNPLLFELAHYFKEDPWLTAGIALTALSLHSFQRKPDRMRLCVLAAATALAAAGKYLGITLLPMALWAVWRLSTPSADAGGASRRRWTAMGLFLLVFALVWLGLNYWLFKSGSRMWSSVGEEMDKAYGNSLLSHGAHILRFYGWLQSHYGGWAVPCLASLWVLWAVGHPRRIPAAEWLLAGTSLLYFVIFSLTPKVSERYYLPISVSLCYFAVAGVMVWAQAIPRHRRGLSIAGLVLAAGLAVGAAGTQYPALEKTWTGFTFSDRQRLEQWIVGNLPADAVIAQDEAVNLPEPDRMSKKHAGRTPLPQRVLGAKKLTEIGTIAQMQAKGVTHAAICQRIYARYLDGTLDVREGQALEIQQLYSTLLRKGLIVWEAPRGRNTHLQPGLTLIDIRGIPTD
ncbi:MAG: phospholipid carrier-dependent glycosyltransferase [Verrucomicrobiaceae bacterium]|nr:MAG: phospholipid carrier-dependent glycosyltransferase [Verrucomicrobiaceae bacterium]